MTQYELELYEELYDILDKLEMNIDCRLNTLPDKLLTKMMRTEKRFVRKMFKLCKMELAIYAERNLKGAGK